MTEMKIFHTIILGIILLFVLVFLGIMQSEYHNRVKFETCIAATKNIEACSKVR